MAEPTGRELVRLLGYPKFGLTHAEVEQLLSDLLPWSETWQQPLESSEPLGRDPRDQVLLDLARAAKVNALVSGDADLLALRDLVDLRSGGGFIPPGARG